jgi:hypothetical protein
LRGLALKIFELVLWYMFGMLPIVFKMHFYLGLALGVIFENMVKNLATLKIYFNLDFSLSYIFS